MLTEAQRIFVGTPDCKLRRYTKPECIAAYFCEQCRHFSKTNECPFAGRAALAAQERDPHSSGSEG
jgi:hypothetical protein